MFTLETLEQLWPHGDSKIPGLRAAIAATAPAVFTEFGITSSLVVAHAMAQISEECREGEEPEEDLNYTTAGRIAKVWPRRFTPLTAVPFVRNARALANKVYGGRMGNGADNDDGYNNRGRGGAQTTGADGYAALAERVLLDLHAHPELVNDPAHFLRCAIADFVLCGCVPFAESDDVDGVTHHLNGGLTGLDMREAWLARWKIALRAEGHDVTEPAEENDGTLRFGDTGFQVKALQQRLTELGYSVGATDEKFGRATRSAVMAFQADRGMLTTGMVDAATRDALARDLPKPVIEARATATSDDVRKAGSTTIAAADVVKTVGTVTAAGSAVTGLDQSGALDKVKDLNEHLHGIKEVVESLQDAVQFLTSHWYVAGIVAAFVLWYYANSIIKKRVADHQSGANLGR
jgi:putative chitinase